MNHTKTDHDLCFPRHPNSTIAHKFRWKWMSRVFFAWTLVVSKMLLEMIPNFMDIAYMFPNGWATKRHKLFGAIIAGWSP